MSTKLSTKDIAQKEKLQVVDTTTARNGYPENCKFAIIGFRNFQQAEDLAKTHHLRITTLYRRNGWQLWVRNSSTTFEPMKIAVEDYGDDYKFYQKGEEQEFFDFEIRDYLENFENFEDLISFINEKMEIYEKIKNADNNEVIILSQGLYYESREKECLEWQHDTENYIIALVDDNEE